MGSPGTTTTTTQTSTSTTSTTTSTSTSTTNPPSCGFVPETCRNPLQNVFKKLDEKTFRKFEEITGVAQSEATIEDVQLYFYCKDRSPSKCTGLQAPCTCSQSPCLCPGDEPVSTSTTPSTTMSTTTTTPATSSSTTTTTSTTTSTTSTTTPDAMQRCALSACGCDLSGASWCNDSNAWLATEWCHVM